MLVESILPIQSWQQLYNATKLEDGTVLTGFVRKGVQPYVRKVKLPELKVRRMNELPVKLEDIDTLREQASQQVLRAYHGELQEVIAVQIELAKTARNEAVRMKAGQKVSG